MDMPSAVKKRSLRCNGRKTSMTLEDEFWQLFCDMASAGDLTPSKLYERFVDTCPPGTSMTSHVRTTILNEVIKQGKAHGGRSEAA